MNEDEKRALMFSVALIGISALAIIVTTLWVLLDDVERLKRVTAPRLATVQEKGPAMTLAPDNLVDAAS